MRYLTVLIVLLTLILSACGLDQIDAKPNPDTGPYSPLELSEITEAARDGTLTDAQREVWCSLLEHFSSTSDTSFEAFLRDKGMILVEEDDLLRGARQQWIDVAEEDGCEWTTLLPSKNN
jgi:hypothetical protein